jgi:hypothetical protein
MGLAVTTPCPAGTTRVGSNFANEKDSIYQIFL